MKLRPFAFLFILAVILAACNIPTVVVPTPTTEPTPPEATPTEPPTEPTPPDATPTTGAAPTPTLPDEPERPDEAIMILEPGSGSRVTSPIRVMGWADPTFEQNLVIRVLTAEGDTLALEPTTIQSELGQRGPFEIVLPVPLSAEENIFIQVYASSARDGGITHLSSVGVTFTPGGDTDIITREPHSEQISIFQPQIRDVISGGVARVEGYGLASFEQTLVVEVQDENGVVVGSEPVMVQAPDLGYPGPFSVDVPYSVSQAGAGRIAVRDISPAHGDNTHVSTVEIQLEP
jgi:hypothetical protein